MEILLQARQESMTPLELVSPSRSHSPSPYSNSRATTPGSDMLCRPSATRYVCTHMLNLNFWMYSCEIYCSNFKRGENSSSSDLFCFILQCAVASTAYISSSSYFRFIIIFLILSHPFFLFNVFISTRLLHQFFYFISQ